MAGGLKPPPSRANMRGATPFVGEADCIFCGGRVHRKRSDLPWRRMGSGNFKCALNSETTDGEHDVSRVPNLQDQDQLERWLDT